MLLSKAKVADSGIPDAGLGLFTSEPLTQGTVVYRFDQNTDQLLTENDICELPPERQDYIRSHGRYSEEAKVWALDTDDAVYINHSEKPNLRGKGGPARSSFRMKRGVLRDFRHFRSWVCVVSKVVGIAVPAMRGEFAQFPVQERLRPRG